jgi:hypothetical protein
MRCEISKVINFVWKEEFVFQREKLFNAAVCKKMVMKPAAVITKQYHCYQLNTKFYPAFCCHV